MSTNMRPLGCEDIEARSFSGHNSDIGRKILPIEAPIKMMGHDGHTDVNAADTEQWANSLESMLEDVPKYMCNPGHPGRIGRIPENLREVDIKSYEPCYLSLGPYHHGKPSLQHMEKRKWVVLKGFLELKPELTLKSILKEFKGIEPEVRSFYTDVEMETEKFVQMLLLDSLYVVVMFCGMPKSQESIHQAIPTNWNTIDNEEENDGVNQTVQGIGFMHESENGTLTNRMDHSDHGTKRDNNMNGLPWFWTLLVHDLFLLENQLPFFVLQKMHGIAYGDSGILLTVPITSMFQHLLLDYVKIDSEISPTEEIHHLLHFCHLLFRPTVQPDLTTIQPIESSQMFRLGSAVQLYEAGVSFEAKSCSTPHSLLDITFSRPGKMTMPCLHVDDNTNSLLRNLIALEQMKYPSMGLHVSAYVVLILHLVTDPADVKLLRRKGIIQHHLASDKEMMYFINRLSVGLAFDYEEDEYSLKPVFHELKRCTSKRVPQWRARLKHKYFNNPWKTISLMAASFLLLLTAIQTFYQVYSYYHPYFGGHS